MVTAYTQQLADGALIDDNFSLGDIIIGDELFIVLNLLSAAGIPNNRVYSLKSIPVRMAGTYAATWRESEAIEYVGYGGRQRMIDYTDVVQIYSTSDNINFQLTLAAFKRAVLAYNSQHFPYKIVGGNFLFINSTDERNELDEERGIQMYHARIVIRLFQYD